MSRAETQRATPPVVRVVKATQVTLRDDADGQYDQEFQIKEPGEGQGTTPATRFAVVKFCSSQVRCSVAEAEAILQAVKDAAH